MMNSQKNLPLQPSILIAVQSGSVKSTSGKKRYRRCKNRSGLMGKPATSTNKYQASGWDRSFYDIHTTDVILHRAAKKYFNELGYGKGKKLPSS